jgi:hypothetical protein
MLILHHVPNLEAIAVCGMNLIERKLKQLISENWLDKQAVLRMTTTSLFSGYNGTSETCRPMGQRKAPLCLKKFSLLQRSEDKGSDEEDTN